MTAAQELHRRADDATAAGRKRDEGDRIRTWFPGRDSAVAAIAAPTSANRRGVGRTTARLSARLAGEGGGESGVAQKRVEGIP